MDYYKVVSSLVKDDDAVKVEDRDISEEYTYDEYLALVALKILNLSFRYFLQYPESFPPFKVEFSTDYLIGCHKETTGSPEEIQKIIDYINLWNKVFKRKITILIAQKEQRTPDKAFVRVAGTIE